MPSISVGSLKEFGRKVNVQRSGSIICYTRQDGRAVRRTDGRTRLYIQPDVMPMDQKRASYNTQPADVDADKSDSDKVSPATSIIGHSGLALTLDAAGSKARLLEQDSRPDTPPSCLAASTVTGTVEPEGDMPTYLVTLVRDDFPPRYPVEIVPPLSSGAARARKVRLSLL